MMPSYLDGRHTFLSDNRPYIALGFLLLSSIIFIPKLNKVEQEGWILYAKKKNVAYFDCKLYCGKYCSNFHIAIQDLFDLYYDIPINWYIVTSLLRLEKCRGQVVRAAWQWSRKLS